MDVDISLGHRVQTKCFMGLDRTFRGIPTVRGRRRLFDVGGFSPRQGFLCCW